MRRELQDVLFEKYPKLLRKEDLKWGLQCGDGWYDIIDKLCAVLQHRVDTGDNQEQVVAYRIKEKMGGLRFNAYVPKSLSDFALGAVTMAEAASFRICEECGSPGSLRRGTWFYTLCDEHHKNREARWQRVSEELKENGDQ